MKYYSEQELAYFLNTKDLNTLMIACHPIKVRFCRDCPCFETNYWQKDPTVVSGWCKRLSYYETLNDETPYYVYVNSNNFCNEDNIKEEDE